MGLRLPWQGDWVSRRYSRKFGREDLYAILDEGVDDPEAILRPLNGAWQVEDLDVIQTRALHPDANGLIADDLAVLDADSAGYVSRNWSALPPVLARLENALEIRQTAMGMERGELECQG